MLKGGGGTQSFEVVLKQELEVLAILKGGTKGFNPFKGGVHEKLYSVLKGWHNRFGMVILPFCSPPPSW